MNRTILHSDCNCFYASVELLHHPELRGKPVAVGGDPEARHGIVLTADYTAKRYGVKTGMALWQAKQVCPDITFLPPRMDLYLRFSRMAQEIYADYTDKREPYGIDESWLDVTDSATLKGDGFHIAQEISSRMKKELGITVSVGVSFNKIFAKLGSDYKKPDPLLLCMRMSFRERHGAFQFLICYMWEMQRIKSYIAWESGPSGIWQNLMKRCWSENLARWEAFCGLLLMDMMNLR